MSGKATGRCWEADLPQTQKFVLLAMADHADHLGHNIRPSRKLLSWKTGMSTRQLRRVIGDLVKKGILVLDEEARQHRPNAYHINWEELPRLESDEPREDIRIPRGDIQMSPLDGENREDNMSALKPQGGQISSQGGHIRHPGGTSGCPPNGRTLTGTLNGRDSQNQIRSWDDVLLALSDLLGTYICHQHFSDVEAAWDAASDRWLIHVPSEATRAFIRGRLESQMNEATAPASWILVDEAEELDVGRPTTTQAALVTEGQERSA